MANLLLFANNASTTLLGAVGPTDVTLTLPNSQGALFPSPTAGYSFMLTLADTSGNIEVVECTGRTNDVLTVVRGREGTAAKSFTAGSVAEARVTAGMLAYLDWQTAKNTANGPLVLDATGKAPIATFDTPLQVYGDNRWNAKLGWTPVQQGGGTGQGTNKIYIGWDGSNVLVQVDTTPFQVVLRTGGGTAMQLTNARYKAASSANEDDLYMGPLGWFLVGNTTWGVGLYHPTKGAGWSFVDSDRSFNVNGPIRSNGIGVSLTGHAHNISDVANLQNALNGCFSIYGGYLYGDLVSSGGHQFYTTGAITGGSVTDLSDARIKESIKPMTVEDATAIVRGTVAQRFFNTATMRDDFGVVADLQEVTSPELIHFGAGGLRSVAYQRLTAPIACVVTDLLDRVAALEQARDATV
jgi:hypothetical protein